MSKRITKKDLQNLIREQVNKLNEEEISDEKLKELKSQIEVMLRPGESFLSHSDIMDIANEYNVSPEKVAEVTSSVATKQNKEKESEKDETFDFIFDDLVKEIRKEKGKEEDHIPSFDEFYKKLRENWGAYDELTLNMNMDDDEIERRYKKIANNKEEIKRIEQKFQHLDENKKKNEAASDIDYGNAIDGDIDYERLDKEFLKKQNMKNNSDLNENIRKNIRSKIRNIIKENKMNENRKVAGGTEIATSDSWEEDEHLYRLVALERDGKKVIGIEQSIKKEKPWRITPGQWRYNDLMERGPGKIAIDAGQGWVVNIPDKAFEQIKDALNEK